ncbi:MAG: TIGR02281 family clan AA aspartic protease [Paracoccaceae bacterium]|nr:TIGR02281 family clan AA aspartic protease [Loktanella sp.]
MNADQIANLAFLGLLGAAIAGSYFMSQRGNLGKTAQQAAVWGLIFVGVIAAVGMWSDIRNTVSPRQQIDAAGEIVLPRQPNGHYYLTLDVNDVPVDFVVDTGASQIVLSQEDAARVGIDPASLRYLGVANTANGQVRTAPVWLDRISLGEMQDFEVPAVVNDGQMDGSLLGMTYLDSFDTIQIRNGELILQRD